MHNPKSAAQIEAIWRAAERLADHLRDAGYTDKSDPLLALTEGVAAMQEDFKRIGEAEDENSA